MSNNVLIVDDTPENLRILTEILQLCGYETRANISGAAALQSCLDLAPDLILLDITMPGMDGYEVCKRLKAEPSLCEIPVVFMSGLTNAKDKVEAFRAGGVDYITKPFYIEEVEARVATHIALHRQRQELAQAADELRANHHAISEDIAMARELQIALLPQQFPSFTLELGGHTEDAAHFHSLYQPSASLSGDFFDVFRISDDKAGLLICDVMGHGVRAALVATILQSQVRALKPLWSDPGAFMNELNRIACRVLKNTQTTLFASAFYVVADLHNGILSYANAGHPWPLRIDPLNHPHCASTLECKKRGPALGIFHGAAYGTGTTQISPPETFLFFTDGLFEVESPDGSFYDYETLKNEVGEIGAADITNICDRVVDGIRQFTGRRDFSDDVCVVSMTVDHLIAQAPRGELAMA